MSPAPSIEERDPNEELGRLLSNFQESHPSRSTLDATVSEHKYLNVGINEYWGFNRFARTLTIFKPNHEPVTLSDPDVLTTPLLPGFELPLARIFECATSWADD